MAPRANRRSPGDRPGRPPGSPPQPPRGPETPKDRRRGGFDPPSKRIDFYVDMTLDLHGYRPRDALQLVDVHLLRCQAAGLLIAHIVHGRGTGTLKAAVREHLASHPLVARFSDGTYGMGGDGVTVVKLKRSA